MQKNTILRRQLFVSLGLSDKEAVLYDTLLNHGQLPAASLEKISGLKKNTYILLKRLERRGLVQKMIKDGKSHYIVGSPEQLQAFTKEQETRTQGVKQMLGEMMPGLKKAYTEAIDRPTVKYFAGLEGLRVVFDEVYAPGKSEVWGCVGNEVPDKELYDEIINKYKPMRILNGIMSRVISPDSPRARELKSTQEQDLKEKFLIDGKKYPMPGEFDTWGDKIALMSFARSDFQAVLIEHPELAKVMQSLLRLATDLLRERENKPTK